MTNREKLIQIITEHPNLLEVALALVIEQLSPPVEHHPDDQINP